MKKSFLTAFLLLGLHSYSQEHFSGISTSKRVGILNVNLNPAELTNLHKKFEVNIFGVSLGVSNNKIALAILIQMLILRN